MTKPSRSHFTLGINRRSSACFSLDGERLMKRKVWLLLLIPTLASVIAVVLFVAQRGFGGGHGDFDRAIGLLGMPSILLLEHVPIHAPDILLIVLFPAILNFIIWSLVVLLLSALLRGHQTI